MSLPPNLMPEPGDSVELTDAVQGAVLEPSVTLPPEPRFPSWSGWDVLAVLILTVLVVFSFSLVAFFVARSMPQYKNVPATELATNAGLVVGSQATAYPIVLLFMFVLVRSRSRQRFRDAIHWNWPGISAPGFFVLGIVLALVIEGLSRFLPIPKSLPLDKFFADATSAYLMAFFGIALAPLLEELFFRGLLYPVLRRTFGLLLSVLLTAAAFAAIHGAQLGYAWAPILSIFVVGVVFTVARERTRSVAASFLMHCGYNFALFSMLWLASDHYRHLEKVAGLKMVSLS